MIFICDVLVADSIDLSSLVEGTELQKRVKVGFKGIYFSWTCYPDAFVTIHPPPQSWGRVVNLARISLLHSPHNVQALYYIDKIGKLNVKKWPWFLQGFAGQMSNTPLFLRAGEDLVTND